MNVKIVREKLPARSAGTSLVHTAKTNGSLLTSVCFLCLVVVLELATD